MTVAKRLAAGISGNTHGFSALGFTTVNLMGVERTNFSTDEVAEDIGDLATEKRLSTGHEG